MLKKTAAILYAISVLGAISLAAPQQPGIIKTDIVTISVEQQHDFINPNSSSALAIHFELKKDWHFYASAKTARAGVYEYRLPGAF